MPDMPGDRWVRTAGRLALHVATSARRVIDRALRGVFGRLPPQWQERLRVVRARLAAGVARGRSATRRAARSVHRRLPPSTQRRTRGIYLAMSAALGRRPRRRAPVTVPGAGPVVLLVAIGVAWADTVAAVECRRDRQERLVVVTDQPVMHLVRSLGAVVEYVCPPPANDSGTGILETRLAEIRRVYAVDETAVMSAGRRRPPGTVARC